MKCVKVAAVLLACVSMVMADSPTTRPASPTTTQRASAPTTKPATQLAATTPTTKAVAKIPTPSELLEKWKKQKEEVASKSGVAYIELNGAIAEKPSGFSLFGGETPTLRSLIGRFHKARDDKGVSAVLITVGAGSSLNFAQAMEIRTAIGELRRAGKKIFIYADAYDTLGYIVASACTNVCLLEGGEIMVPGIGFETMFYKDLFDKVGVKADYIQIGEYKGADESYTRAEPSEELKGEMNKLVDAMFDQIVSTISAGRSLSKEKVRAMIDDMAITAKVAKDRGFIDHIITEDNLRATIEEEIGDKINVMADYGQDESASIDPTNFWGTWAKMMAKPEISDKPSVAIIYAEGVISDGEGGGGLFSLGESGIGSESMRRTFRAALEDDNIKAIVLRIDSPGGSALASEVMWQSLRRVAAKKPVIISVGSMAASGGYYLASAGDYIFADPSAIVGSIGVVGGKMVLKDLYDKLGLRTTEFSKGRNATLFSSNQPWDEREKRMVRTWMQQTYDQFTQRIMVTRTGKITDIDKVARGRIFLAGQAKELGMVDELGGTESAIKFAAGRADLDEGEYQVRTFPPAQTLADLLSGSAGPDARFPFAPKIEINADSVLHLLPDSQRRLIMQQLQIGQLMQKRPVLLVSPFVMTIK